MNSRAVLLKIYHSYQSPRDPVKTVSDSVGIGWGLTVSLCDKLPANTEHSVGHIGSIKREVHY